MFGGRNSIQTTLGLSWLWTIFCLFDLLFESIFCALFFDLVLNRLSSALSRALPHRPKVLTYLLMMCTHHATLDSV
jgi:hypothetical protein